MTPYEQRKQNRIDRLKAAAERASQESSASFRKAHQAVEHIPFGQPILIGHHSERRHRADIARSESAMRKAVELSNKAADLASRAKGAELNDAISSDDPEAITKLTNKLADLETDHEAMVAANAIIRKALKLGATQENLPTVAPVFFNELVKAIGAETNPLMACKLLKPDFCGRIGFPAYALSLSNTSIKRVKERIKGLQQKAAIAETLAEENGGSASKSWEKDGYVVTLNLDENRLQIEFPDKPDADTRSLLKSNGFRWSPNNGVWQAYLSAGYKLKLRVLPIVCPGHPYIQAGSQ